MQPQLQNILFEQVAFSTTEGYTVVPLQDIVCCEAEGSYAKMHLCNGEEILISKSLKKLEEFLPEDFFIRVHHHVIVGKLHIRKFLTNDGLELEMSNGERLNVAVRRRGILMKMLKVF